MNDDSIIVNQVGLHLTPMEWITFRNWAKLEGGPDIDSTVAMSKIREFKVELKQAVFDLYLWQHKDADHFTARLFGLIAKADLGNRLKLALGFPIEVLAWLLWQGAPSEKEFFDNYKLK